MSKLKIVVLYDRVLVDEAEETATPDKSPVVRTLDKKEVEEEVAEALTKLGHEPTMHELDGTPKSLLALARLECDLIFNLTESFADDDTADFKIAGFLELVGKRYTGSGTHGLMLAQDKAIAKKIFAFHGIHTPVFAKSFRGRLDFSHDLQFPVIVKPAREDGSIGIEFSAVVSSIRELMERMDWLHANFNSPVLIEEYIEGREMYVGVIGNDKPEALPVVELDLSKLPDGTPRIAAAEVKWGKGTKAYRDTKSAVATDLPEETVTALQQTAVAAYQALELRDYGRVDMRLQPDGRVHVIEVNPNPWLSSKAEFAMAARKSGRNYPQLVEEIVDLAMAQSLSQLPTPNLQLPRSWELEIGNWEFSGSYFPVRRPQVERSRSPVHIPERIDDFRLPVAHRETVRDDPGTAAQLSREDRTKLHVRCRQQIERDDRRIRHIDCHRVLDQKFHASLDASRLGVGFCLIDQVGVDVHADTARAELLRGGDDDPPIAASKVVHHIARADLREREHALHDIGGCRHVRREAPALCCERRLKQQRDGRKHSRKQDFRPSEPNHGRIVLSGRHLLSSIESPCSSPEVRTI